MSDIIGNGKINGLIAYLENLSAKGKVRASAITPLKSAVKTVFSVVEGEEWGNIDSRSIDLDDYFRRFKNLTMGNYDSSSYSTYRARISKALDWYGHFLQDPGWAPVVKERAKDKKKVKLDISPTIHIQDIDSISEAETIPGSQIEQVASTNNYKTSSKLISFPFPMSNGIMSTLYLPQNISQKDADRLQAFIQTLVVEHGETHEI